MLQGHYEAALAKYQEETLDDGHLEGASMVYFAIGRKVESDSQLGAAMAPEAQQGLLALPNRPCICLSR